MRRALLVGVGMLWAMPASGAEWVAGAAGALVLNHPALAAEVSGEYWPDDFPLGLRWHALAVGEDRLILDSSLARLVGDSRPHLAISIHAGLGLEVREPAAVGSMGLTTRLKLKGPLSLLLDGSGYLVVTSDRLELLLVSSLGVAISF